MSRPRSGQNLSSTNGPKLQQHPQGRVCEREACSTVLSVYNKSPYCSVHEPRTFYPNPGR